MNQYVWTLDYYLRPRLSEHSGELLDFALDSVADAGGFGWLDDHGNIDFSHDRELWINCRMTHVMAIGTLLEYPTCSQGLSHGVEALGTLFRDGEHGGWFTAVDWDGSPSDAKKAAYPHAFVILATSSALAAGNSAALPLLREALATSEAYFWDEAVGLVKEEWDRTFTTLSEYRGVNANMHTVEAYLAAADVLDHFVESGSGDLWRKRAVRILDFVVNQQARANSWRIPEHFDEQWQPLLDYNKDHPADPFRPYGATIGHGLEWARLTVQAYVSVGGGDGCDWMPQGAIELYNRAISDGWAVDGAEGFVYTTDWSGHPIVHERMHWVLAEALGAARALAAIGQATTANYEQWWSYAERYLIDRDLGSWHHELDAHNQPSALVWSGKPDVYHALQATLLPMMPITPAIVPALATLRTPDKA